MERPTWTPWRGTRALYRLSQVSGKPPLRKPLLTLDDALQLQDVVRSDLMELRKSPNASSGVRARSGVPRAWVSVSINVTLVTVWVAVTMGAKQREKRT